MKGEYNMEEKKSRRKGCLMGAFILSGVITIVLVVSVLLVIRYLKTDMTVEVDYDQKDLETCYEKLEIENDSNTPSLNDILYIRYETSRSGHPLDVSLTNEEITALFDDVSSKDDFIQDVRFRGTDDGEFEVSFKISNVDDMLSEAEDGYPEIKDYETLLDVVKDKVEDSVVYYSGSLDYDSENGFESDSEKFKVGMIPIPDEQQQFIVEALCDLLDRMVVKSYALNIESLSVNEDGIDFVGTFPDEIDVN